MKRGAYGCLVVATLCLVSRLEACIVSSPKRKGEKERKSYQQHVTAGAPTRKSIPFKASTTGNAFLTVQYNLTTHLGCRCRPPSYAKFTNVLVRIIVKLLSTLALATEQVKQGRFSKFALAALTLYSMQHREIYEEVPGRA